MNGTTDALYKCGESLQVAKEDKEFREVIECYQEVLDNAEDARGKLNVLMMMCQTYLRLKDFAKSDYTTTLSLLGKCAVLASESGNHKNRALVLQMRRYCKQREHETV